MLGCAGRDPIGPAAVKEPKMWLWLMIDSQKIGWFSTRFGAELVPICGLDWYLIFDDLLLSHTSMKILYRGRDLEGGQPVRFHVAVRCFEKTSQVGQGQRKSK